jgi:LysM repeat protein
VGLSKYESSKGSAVAKSDRHDRGPSHHEEKKRDEPSVHIVKKGETLSVLAKRFHTTVQELKKENHLKSDTISIGQRVRIPDVEIAEMRGGSRKVADSSVPQETPFGPDLPRMREA